VEIKVPGSPDGPRGYGDLTLAMAEQWREFLALGLCYVVIGAYWLQHHYSGRICAKSDHWFGALNLLFLLAIVPPPDDAALWHRDADPDRRSSDRDRGAARRCGDRAAVRRLLP